LRFADAPHEVSGQLLISQESAAAQTIVLKRKLADFIE
jgi:hypothetical protein